jgi:hypothetical protein
VVHQHRGVRVGLDIPEALEAERALALAVDRRIDGVAFDHEHSGHQVRLRTRKNSAIARTGSGKKNTANAQRTTSTDRSSKSIAPETLPKL